MVFVPMNLFVDYLRKSAKIWGTHMMPTTVLLNVPDVGLGIQLKKLPDGLNGEENDRSDNSRGKLVLVLQCVWLHL